jgi:hypothetical protein
MSGCRSCDIGFLLNSAYEYPDEINRPWSAASAHLEHQNIRVDYDSWFNFFKKDHWLDLRRDPLETIVDPNPELECSEPRWWSIDNPVIYKHLSVSLELASRILRDLVYSENEWSVEPPLWSPYFLLITTVLGERNLPLLHMAVIVVLWVTNLWDTYRLDTLLYVTPRLWREVEPDIVFPADTHPYTLIARTAHERASPLQMLQRLEDINSRTMFTFSSEDENFDMTGMISWPWFELLVDIDTLDSYAGASGVTRSAATGESWPVVNLNVGMLRSLCSTTTSFAEKTIAQTTLTITVKAPKTVQVHTWESFSPPAMHLGLTMYRFYMS